MKGKPSPRRKTERWIVGAIGLTLTLFALPAIMSPEAPNNTPDQDSSISRTVQDLRQISPPGGEGDTDVPVTARALLAQLKHQLRDLIASVLSSQVETGITSTVLSDAVTKELAKDGIRVEGRACRHAYGCISGISVKRLSVDPELLVATTTLDVPCAEDTSLYVFERQGARSRLRLSAESDGYRQTWGAQDNLQYAFVAPSGEGGPWSVVIAYMRSGCTSIWRGVRLSVLRPTGAPDRPQTILSQHENVNLSTFPFALTAKGDTFELNFGGNFLLDAPLVSRRHIVKYRVGRSSVTRLPPLAFEPQDFVDEWVQLPWDEASRWVLSPDPENVQQWHRRVQRAMANENVYMEFDFVQPCSVDSVDWQVGLNISNIAGAGKEISLPAELFFSVYRKQEPYYITSISPTRPPGCPGETRPSENNLDHLTIDP